MKVWDMEHRFKLHEEVQLLNKVKQTWFQVVQRDTYALK
jgi:uncharacterized protein YxjI